MKAYVSSILIVRRRYLTQLETDREAKKKREEGREPR